MRSQSKRGHIGTFILFQVDFLLISSVGCEKISTVHILGSMAMDSAELPEKSRLIEKLSFKAFNSGSEIEVEHYVFGYR